MVGAFGGDSHDVTFKQRNGDQTHMEHSCVDLVISNEVMDLVMISIYVREWDDVEFLFNLFYDLFFESDSYEL